MIERIRAMFGRRGSIRGGDDQKPLPQEVASDRAAHQRRISRADAVIRDGMGLADEVFERRPYGGRVRREH